VYTVTIYGTIPNLNSEITTSTDFVLTVLSCTTASETITIIPSATKPVSFVVGASGSSVKIIAFNLDSNYCTS